MRKRHSSSFRTLLLLCLLAVGPLQAQAAYACAMMDTVVHDDCCCGDSASVTERGTPAVGERLPCCEVSVRITVDQETRQHTPAFKPPDPHPDIDPAPATITTFDGLLPSFEQPAPHTHHSDRPLPGVGSDTWLITRRLRI